MNRLYTLLLVLIAALASGEINAQASAYTKKAQMGNKVIIEGAIEGALLANTINVKFYKDYISFEEVEYTATIKNNRFSISFPIDVPTPGFLTYKDQTLPIFLEGGDHFNLYSTDTSFIKDLTYDKNGALKNNYLKESYLLFDQNDAQLVKESMLQNTAEDFESFLHAYKAKKLAFLDQYLSDRDTTFSKAFSNYVKADINYWWGHQLMAYKDHHPTSHLLPISLTLPNAYYNFIDELNLNNEEALNNLNYLKYLEHYTAWRQDRISKGLLKIEGRPTRKKTVELNRVETFGAVLMDELEVRAEAHDQNSVLGKLKKRDKVLYLRDVTNDRFSYTYGGRKYIDEFLKIQMADGQVGWVFKMGLRVFEDIVTEVKEVELPEDPSDILQALRYSEFRGKVLHYAVSKTLYDDIRKGKRVPRSKLDDYIKLSPYGEYVQLLESAYIQRGYGQPIPYSSIRGTSAEAIVTEEKVEEFTKNLTSLLKVADTEKKSIKPKVKSKPKPAKIVAPTPVTAATTLPEKGIVLPEVSIAKPDFSPFVRITSLSFKTNIPTGERPIIAINENPLLKKEKKYPLSNSSGSAYIKVATSLSMPTTWEIRAGKQAIEFYCKPGDDIKVDIMGNNIYEQITFSGPGSAENQYLLKAAENFSFVKEALDKNKKDVKPVDFKVWLNNIRREKLEFYYSYIDEHALNPSFYPYAKANIDYWYAFNLMNYLYEYPFLNELPYPMEASADYLSFMSEIPVNNDAALPNRFFINYIQEYIAFQNRQVENIGLSRYELAEKYLTGATKEFFQAILLSLKTQQKNQVGLSHQIQEYTTTSSNKLYSEYVKAAYLDAKGIIEGMKAPAFELVDLNGKRVQLSDYKGKVVLLDFWATWCGPCIDLMPVHKSLKERFKEKNVAFVYVSMDTSPHVWKNFISKKQFAGEHLISGEMMGLKSPIATDYKIKYLPFTLLLDTNGTIVWQRTGGFSVNNLIKEMETLLVLD